MRELKFRVWSNLTKKFNSRYSHSVEELHSTNEYYGYSHSCLLDALDDAVQDPNIIIEQYTGLKDKNCREIYEGDILKIKYLIQPIERHIKGDFHPVEWLIDGWYCFGRTLSLLLQGGSVSGELVGNIHENPELLNASL